MHGAVWKDFLTCPKALISAHVEVSHSREHLCSWKRYCAQEGPSGVAASAQVSLDLGSRYFQREMRWQELQTPKISPLTLGKALYMPYMPYVLRKELQAPSSGESSQVLVKTQFFKIQVQQKKTSRVLRFSVLLSQLLHHFITLQKQQYDAESPFHGSLLAPAHNSLHTVWPHRSKKNEKSSKQTYPKHINARKKTPNNQTTKTNQKTSPKVRSSAG